MVCQPLLKRNGFEDRVPGQFVSEVEGRLLDTQHPDRDAFVQRIRVSAGHGSLQPRLDPKPDHGRSVQHLPGLRGQPRGPRQDGVPHCRRNPRCAARQNLGDDERVSARLTV